LSSRSNRLLMAQAIAVAAFLFIAFSACSYPAASRAEGIGALVEAGKSMDSAKKALNQETANFNGVKSAIESGALRKGLSKQAIASQYGEPVVINEDFATKRERWVYKPASSSFFEGARICLLFDSSGALDEMVALQ